MIPGSGRSAGEGICYPLQYSWASLVAQLVKNPPAMPETWVQSLDWEDPQEKGKATPVLWPREFHVPYSLWGCKESDTTERLTLSEVHDGRHLPYYGTSQCKVDILQFLRVLMTWGQGEWGQRVLSSCDVPKTRLFCECNS